MNKTELQQVRDALKFAYNDCESDFVRDQKIDPAIALIDADLARVVEPASCQFQCRSGEWANFINEKHKADTIADGTWPIRYLYAAPQDAEAKEAV